MLDSIHLIVKMLQVTWRFYAVFPSFFQDVFIPCHDSLMVNLKESKEVVPFFLRTLFCPPSPCPL